MLAATTPPAPLTSANAPLLFPVLSTAQISRIASHGLIRPITRGEVLIEGGQTNVPFFVVKAGEIEVIRPSGLGAAEPNDGPGATFALSVPCGNPSSYGTLVSGSRFAVGGSRY